ncbi:MAG: hypothetical protein JSR32_01105 [Proteobacteria bacterium]|nr:hypothetical protein [Pseudomonadota bacterium]
MNPIFLQRLNCASIRDWSSSRLKHRTFSAARLSCPVPARAWRSGRERIFAAMARNAGTAAEYFNLPANRMLELGTRIEI